MKKQVKKFTIILSTILLTLVAINSPINSNPILPMCDLPPVDIDQ